jgi:hypothetical protein
MAAIVIRRFEDPDERREFEHGSFELICVGGVTIGRARPTSRPTIWAGSVATGETIPAQMPVWDESRPDGGAAVQTPSKSCLRIRQWTPLTTSTTCETSKSAAALR